MDLAGQTRFDFTQALRDRRVILCLDEFDRTAAPQRFGADFLDTLRSQANAGRLAMVVATRKPLDELFPAGHLTSPLFDLFARQDLGPLAERGGILEHALAVAQESGRLLTPAQVERAWRTTGGHPWKLAIYLSYLWDTKLSWEEVERLKDERPAYLFWSWAWRIVGVVAGLGLVAVTLRWLNRKATTIAPNTQGIFPLVKIRVGRAQAIHDPNRAMTATTIYATPELADAIRVALLRFYRRARPRRCWRRPGETRPPSSWPAWCSIPG